MVTNVSANSSKLTLHGVYFREEQVTFPLISTYKSCIFDLKIFGQDNLCSNNDIFEQNIPNEDLKNGFKEDFLLVSKAHIFINLVKKQVLANGKEQTSIGDNFF